MSQVWKAIKTNTAPFSYARDGQKVAQLIDGTLVAVAGWHVLSGGIQETNSEVYFSNDKGVTWDRQADAPWPNSHDFCFDTNNAGDTLVKWGIDGGQKVVGDQPRIDIFTQAGGWQHLGFWSAIEVNDGVLLTGCRHTVDGMDYYYMLSFNGKLHRFTLASPVPELVCTISDPKVVQSGFMASIEGRLFFGAGLNNQGVYPGKVWYSDNHGFDGFSHLFIEDDIFKTRWPSFVITKSAAIYWKGRNDVANQKGIYIMDREKLLTGSSVTADWTSLPYTQEECHAAGMCPMIDGTGQLVDEAVGVCGNVWNRSILFERFD